jgi:tetratricopeptide (TPR) repeat protein/predicted Ser/Thr protein kinase
MDVEPTQCLSDDTLARLVAGELESESQASIDRHLAGCASCRAVLGAYGRRFADSAPTGDPEATRPSAELDAGERIGRFEIRERLGAGGMGVVYRAHDPELDRDIALKLLRVTTKTPTELEARHRREAQAMAKLSHPNVVAVYDVGVDRGRVFIASEYIRGMTLQEWLEARPRPWQAIVDAFIEAGRGLCAAHEAGIVHRDFKPSNVMVGDEGRIYVVDFGLARSGARTRAELTADEPTSESELETTTLTRTGAILGTPPFLAPECVDGQSVTRAADQFSFCVALYWAVHGVAPFKASSLAERQQRIRQARLSPGPRRVPTWLERALRRGLAFRPEDRHPSLEVLLDHLQAGRRRGRRALVLGSWALALSAAVGVGYTMAKDPATPALAECEAQDGLAGVWDDARRARVDQISQTLESPYAKEAWSLARAHLDAYAQEFDASRARACASPNRARASLWLDCLARRRASLDVVVGLLEEDPELLAETPKFVAELDSLTSCETASARDEAAEPVSRELRANLERAELRFVAGHYDQARQLALTIAEQAQAEVAGAAGAAGAELEARAHVVRGRALAELGKTDAAIEALDEAVQVALAHDDPRPVLEAWVTLVEVEGVLAARPEQGERWAALAQAMLASQPPQPRLEARLATNLGMIYAATNQLERAVAQHERALERLSEDPRQDVERLEILNNLAGAIARTGDLDGAERGYRRALELAERTLGSGHPHTGILWNNLASVYSGQRRWADAQAAAERALAIKKAALGPTHPSVGMALSALAGILTMRESPEQAIVVLEEALPILEASRGPGHPALHTPLLHLAQAYQAVGRFEDALSVLERAEANARANHGTTHPAYAEVLHFRGRLLGDMGRGQDALADLQRALEICEDQLGPDHHRTRSTRIMLGQAELDLGHRSEARTRLEPLVPEQGELSVLQAHAAFALARSLPASERSRSLSLARRARQALVSRGVRPATVAQIDEFLAEQ